MRKDEIYVINQPKHLLTSIVIVENEFAGAGFPLPLGVHEGLHHLQEISDIIFVFSSERCNEQTTIDFDRFTTLYNGCAWIDSKGNYGKTLMKIFNYDREIFRKSNSTLVINIMDCEEEKLDTNKLLRLISAPLAKPIFEIQRMSSEWFHNIYQKENRTDLNLVSEYWFKFYDKSKEIIENIFKKGDRLFSPDLTKAHAIYTTNSDLMFFKNQGIDYIRNSYDAENLESYIDTFGDSDYRDILASLVKYIGLEHLDQNYKDIKLQ